MWAVEKGREDIMAKLFELNVNLEAVDKVRMAIYCKHFESFS